MNCKPIGDSETADIAQAAPKEKKMQIAKWTPTMKFKCPDCAKGLVPHDGRYHCANCNMHVQLVMHMVT